MMDKTNRVLEAVNPARREFMKKLLAGAAFAAPIVATFSIDTLTANAAPAFLPNTVYYPNSSCPTDAGYSGPTFFLAHVSVKTAAPYAKPPKPPNGPKAPVVNGEVEFVLLPTNGGYLNAIQVDLQFVDGVTLDTLLIYTTPGPGPAPAVTKSLGGSPAVLIFASDLNTKVVCDLDELVDDMAAGLATAVVTGTYQGSSFVAAGPIVGVAATNIPG
jgi:hypothetical protein